MNIFSGILRWIIVLQNCLRNHRPYKQHIRVYNSPLFAVMESLTWVVRVFKKSVSCQDCYCAVSCETEVFCRYTCRSTKYLIIDLWRYWIFCYDDSPSPNELFWVSDLAPFKSNIVTYRRSRLKKKPIKLNNKKLNMATNMAIQGTSVASEIMTWHYGNKSPSDWLLVSLSKSSQ